MPMPPGNCRLRTTAPYISARVIASMSAMSEPTSTAANLAAPLPAGAVPASKVPFNPESFVASGKVTSIKDGSVVFNPAGTNYELRLAIATYAGPVNVPVKCCIRVTARKVYTVPSGGNFISPIFGPPRIVQGRVRWGDARRLVVHAGCPIHVELPQNDNAIDLDEGAIEVGRMVNVVCLPGASVAFVQG